MAVAVRYPSRVHGCGSIAVDFNRTPILAARASGDLNIGADADSKLKPVTGVPTECLCFAGVVIVAHLEGKVESGLIVAGVVSLADRRYVWERIFSYEVSATQLGGIKIEIQGQLVNRPFEGHRRLWPTSPAIRMDRRRIRHH